MASNILKAKAKLCLLSQLRSCHNGQKVVAIRREDNSVWERRAPLAPSHVREVVKKGHKVLVQPSNRRAYPMQEYVKAGAVERENISDASVILGVKVVPIDLLEPEKTYVFFSHTIKAQDANMPLLDAILEKKIRLVDYEKMVDAKGRRVVAFGKYAGVTGMINILHGLGLRLLALGHHTPFMHIGMAHNYRNSEQAKQAVRDTGYMISLGNMPASLGPLTFVFTGSGNVSQGAQEIFRELPVEFISPANLPKVAKGGALNKVYGCVVEMQDNLVRKSDGKFDGQEFLAHPELYGTTFQRKIAPYTSVLINCIYWAPGAPRFITIPEAKSLLHKQPMPWLPSSDGCPHLPHRFIALCDISADPGGSIEFMKECTTIDHPFRLYDATDNTIREGFAGNGVLFCSIDNMPAQIPCEATDFFGSMLLPILPDILKSDAKTPFEQYDAGPIVKNAVIASNGELTPGFKYIQVLRETKRRAKSTCSDPSKKKVLVLGSGYVSAPVVDYLTRDKDINVTVASMMRNEIDDLANRFPNTSPMLMDMFRSQEDIEKLIQGHDIVVSLLPYALHPNVAQMCIKHKRNMVTASYRAPAMMALDKAAREAGITVVNEVGVDPGIDHLLAMECFDRFAENGGKVKSFISFCGGLPAPESSANSLRYKFSWSPRGVLLNTLSNAKWLQDKEVKFIPEGGALLDSVMPMDFLPGFNLEGFPNRDSTVYSELYGIDSAETIIRGTLRYKGFSNAMKGLVTLGFIDPKEHPLLHAQAGDITWKQFVCELLGKERDLFTDTVKDLVFEKVDRDVARLNTVVELGLLDDELIDKKGTPLDTLSYYLSKLLCFGPTERDVIIMRHDIGVEWTDRSRQTYHVDFVAYGEPGKYSAMAKTVGFPTAIATKMVLESEIQEKGMILPFKREIYKPMLKRLQKLGLTATENVSFNQ